MHVGALVEELNLGVVPPSVVVVPDVQRHMQVFDQVDEESECKASLRDRTVRVLENRPELPDLGHDVTLLGLGP